MFRPRDRLFGTERNCLSSTYSVQTLPNSSIIYVTKGSITYLIWTIPPMLTHTFAKILSKWPYLLMTGLHFDTHSSWYTLFINVVLRLEHLDESGWFGNSVRMLTLQKLHNVTSMNYTLGMCVQGGTIRATTYSVHPKMFVNVVQWFWK